MHKKTKGIESSKELTIQYEPTSKYMGNYYTWQNVTSSTQIK